MIRKIFFASAIVVAISGCTAMDILSGLLLVSQDKTTDYSTGVIHVAHISDYIRGSSSVPQRL